MDHYEDTKAIAERVKQFPWFHSIDLGNGIVTPGSKSPEIHAQEAAAFFDPIRMEGTSVVDVGSLEWLLQLRGEASWREAGVGNG